MHSDDVQLSEAEQRMFDEIAFRLVVADAMTPLADAPAEQPVRAVLPLEFLDEDRPTRRRRLSLVMVLLTVALTIATPFTHSSTAISVVGLLAPLALMAALVVAGGPCPGMRLAQRRR